MRRDDPASVIYRANVGPEAREATLSLRLPPARATAADAYARFAALYGSADPSSIEIEIREPAGGA